MASISVGDVFSAKIFTVNENDPLSKCIELFKKEMPPAIVVLDEKGKYAGVITRRAALRARIDPNTAKIKSLMRSAPKATRDTTIAQAAKMMIEGEIRQLPVIDRNNIVGFVTDENIIHGAVTQECGNTKIEAIMTKTPHTIEANRSIGAVLTQFREYGISHLPVTEKGQPVGMISTHDIIENFLSPSRRQTTGDIVGEKAKPLTLPAKAVMNRPLITIQPASTLKEAEQAMHKHNISSLVVISQGKVAGILTKLDILQTISQQPTIDRKITIQFSAKNIDINPDQRDFMMQEFDSFTRKFKDTLKPGILFVYMKSHGTNHKGETLTHCRIQLITEKGQYYSSSEGFGIEPTFRVALDRLDRRILRSKELASETQYAEDFMRKIGFPTEET